MCVGCVLFISFFRSPFYLPLFRFGVVSMYVVEWSGVMDRAFSPA